MLVTTVIYIERDDEVIEVEVTGHWVPFVKGRMYLSNGDPGYPDEGGYFEEIEIGRAIELTEAELKDAEGRLEWKLLHMR
jgi:hypothetical protein